MNGNDKKRTLLFLVLVVVLTFALTASRLFYSFDKLLSDPIYQTASVPDDTIRILAIDERTIAEYGEFADWSRDIPASLVELLSADPAKAPAVIAFDVLFASDRDSLSDTRFAQACEKAGNVVTVANLVYRTELTSENGSVVVDTDHIRMVEYPYASLRSAARFGFANTWLDKDQFIRYTRLSTD